MTLEEAIKHAEKVATKLECEAMCVEEAYQTARQADCEKCAEEHWQLAEWLTDYQRLLKAIDEIKAEIDENIQDCQLPQGHDLWWNGRKDGLIDALVIINEHIERMIQNECKTDKETFEIAGK